MPIYSEKSKSLHTLEPYSLESDLEKDIGAYAELIFGRDTIYLDIKRRIGGSGIISIPDAYLIDLSDPNKPTLYVIENEIAKHDSFRHIGSQLLRFVTSFDDSRTEIRNFLMKEISSRSEEFQKLTSACKASTFRNIDNLLDSAVYQDFKGLVIIDEVTEELTKVLSKINAVISILEFKRYRDNAGGRIFSFDTLNDDENEEVAGITLDERVEPTKELLEIRRQRRINSDTIVVPAKEEGFNRVFLGENQWHEIRIGAAQKNRLKYIAAYQVSPISKITHIAEIQEIKLYKDTGKYVVIFKGPAKEIGPIELREKKNKPQGPVYVRYENLVSAKYLEDAMMKS